MKIQSQWVSLISNKKVLKIVWAPKREKWTGTKIILKNEFLPFLASKEDIPPGATFKVKCWNCGPITVWHNMTSIQFL